jgi:dynein heavy chain
MLTENEQVRREADDTGPLAEIEHWCQLSVRVNSVLEQTKSRECKMAVGILHIARSKVMKAGYLLLETCGSFQLLCQP